MPLATLTFLIIIAGVPSIPFGTTALRWSFMAVGVAVLLWLGRSHPVRLGPVAWVGAAFFLWIFAGQFWSPSGWDAAGSLLRMSVLAAVFMVASQQKDLDLFWCAVGLGGFIELMAVAVNVWVGGDIPSGLFAGKSPAAEVLVMTAVALTIILPVSTRLVMWSAIVAGLYLLGSREAAFALLVAALAAFWMRSNNDRRMTMLLIGSMCAGPVITLAVTGYLGRFEDRLDLWSKIIPHLSVMGDGPGALSVALVNYEGAYNEFLRTAFEFGIASLLLWGIVIYALGGKRTIEVTALAAVLAFCFVSNPLSHPATAFMGAVLAGYLCGVRADERRSGVDRSRAGKPRLVDEEYLGTGSLCDADAARVDLPFRPQHALDAGTVHGAIWPRRS